MVAMYTNSGQLKIPIQFFEELLRAPDMPTSPLHRVSISSCRQLGSSRSARTLSRLIVSQISQNRVGLTRAEPQGIEEDVILSNLLRADLLLLVVDPIRLLNTPHLECIGRSLVRRKSTHIAVNGHLPSSCTHAEIEARLRDQCRQFAPGSSVPAISFVNSSTAWSAQTLLMGALQSQQESSASRTLAFEKFQTEFLASRLGQLQSSVAETISRQQPSSRQTAVVTTQLALDYIHETVTRDRHTIREATKAVERLGDATDGIVSRANSLIRDENSSAHAMSPDPFAGARSRVLHDLRSRLSFFNLIALGRADDVRPILDRAVESDADSDVMLAVRNFRRVGQALTTACF